MIGFEVACILPQYEPKDLHHILQDMDSRKVMGMCIGRNRLLCMMGYFIKANGSVIWNIYHPHMAHPHGFLRYGTSLQYKLSQKCKELGPTCQVLHRVFPTSPSRFCPCSKTLAQTRPPWTENFSPIWLCPAIRSGLVGDGMVGNPNLGSFL